MKKNLICKQLLVLAVALCVIFTGSLSALAATAQDIRGHWAESSIQSWLDQGLIKGYKDGSFKPDGKVTRAEFIVFINRSFGFTKQATAVPYNDVKTTDWYYRDLSVALAAGYITGNAKETFNANQALTRVEAAAIVSKLLELAPSHSADSLLDAKGLTDAEIRAVGAVVEAKLMTGDAKGGFRPNDKLTRAESVVVLERALQSKFIVYDKPGVYGPTSGTETVSKDVRIVAPGVTLQNMDIKGNLTIAQSVGDGDVFLKQVTVAGTTSVNGGGANSVHFENSVVAKIVVNKADGKIRIVVEGTSEVRDVILESGAKLESASDASGMGFQNVTLADTLPADSKVTLSGKFETVDVLAASINIEIPQGTIGSLNVDKQAGDVSVNLSKEASIVDLVLAAVTKVIGQGVIEKADIQASGSSIEQKPISVKIGDGISADVEGKPATTTAPPVTYNPPWNPNSVNKGYLQQAIASAQLKLDTTVAGIQVGEYSFSARADLLSKIQAAQAVVDNTAATQGAVDGALATLNAARTIYDLSRNYTPMIEDLRNLYNQAKMMINSVPEGSGAGTVAPGSNTLLTAKITEVSVILKNASATPEQVQAGYTALIAAYKVYEDALHPSNLTEVQTALAKADQSLASAVEGDGIGQYRFGAKAILEMDIMGARSVASEAWKAPQHDVDIYTWMVFRALSKFEADKRSANDAVVTVTNPYKHISTYNGNANLRYGSDKQGSIYVVSNAKFPNSKEQLDVMVNEGESVTQSVYAGGQFELDLIALKPGSYKLYHVDDQGQLSKPITDLSISPALVSNISVTSAVVDGKIANTITWADSLSGNDVKYSIRRGKTADVASMDEIVRDVSPGTQQFVDRDSDLEPGETYYYLIMATVPSGQGSGPEAYQVITPTN